MGIDTRSAAGLEFLVARPASGAQGTLLVGLHGRGSSPEALVPLCQGFGGDYLHVLVRAPHPHPTGAAWFAQGAERDAQLADSRARLLELMAHLRRAFGVGPERTGVWGFSQGGTLSLEVGLRVPSALAATACVSGSLDEATRASPEVMRRARGRDFFLLHGTLDDRIPHTLAHQAYGALVAEGARVELAELPMGHEVSRVAAVALRGYLASTLGSLPDLPTA